MYDYNKIVSNFDTDEEDKLFAQLFLIIGTINQDTDNIEEYIDKCIEILSSNNINIERDTLQKIISKILYSKEILNTRISSNTFPIVSSITAKYKSREDLLIDRVPEIFNLLLDSILNVLYRNNNNSNYNICKYIIICIFVLSKNITMENVYKCITDEETLVGIAKIWATFNSLDTYIINDNSKEIKENTEKSERFFNRSVQLIASGGFPDVISDKIYSNSLLFRYTIPNIIPKKDGYTFKGWSKNPDSTLPSQLYHPNDTSLFGEDIILYAIWEENDKEEDDDNVLRQVETNPKKTVNINKKNSNKINKQYMSEFKKKSDFPDDFENIYHQLVDRKISYFEAADYYGVKKYSRRNNDNISMPGLCRAWEKINNLKPFRAKVNYEIDYNHRNSSINKDDSKPSINNEDNLKMQAEKNNLDDIKKYREKNIENISPNRNNYPVYNSVKDKSIKLEIPANSSGWVKLNDDLYYFIKDGKAYRNPVK